MTRYADRGLQYVTGDIEDRYRFRTPSLRNVTLTAPYGHSGAHPTLVGIVRHHLDPMAGLMRYDRAQAMLMPAQFGADDWGTMEDQDTLLEIAAGIELPPQDLTEGEIADILDFLTALTDIRAAKGRLGVTKTVPSGLPVEN